jgi:cardiolipin synthase
MEGKAVYGLQSNFLMDWYFITGSLITASKYYPEIPDVGSALVQTVTSEPMGAWKPIMQGLLLAISSAKHYFYIQSPYFLPTEQIISALQTAALAGVDVRLMIPERSDGRFLRLASCSYVEEMLAAGVKVYFYRKGFLHSKLMVSDDSLSTVGSTNMDFRSFEHNFEINSFIYDRALALRMKEIYLRDQQEARLLNEKEWARRSRKQRVKESIVRLLSPLL